MTIETLIKVLASGDYGDPPSLDAMNADKRTWRPIPLQKLEVLMRRSGMGVMLADMAADEATPEPVRRALTEFQAYIASPRQTVLGADEADIAEQTADVLALIVAEHPEAESLAAEVYQLGGDLR